MKLKQLICLAIFLALMSVSGFAQPSTLSQPYKKGIGLRLANSYYDLLSVSYKFFISEAGAIELNGGFGLRADNYYNPVGSYNGYVKPFTPSFSASYQHHFEIPVRGGGLFWFIGGGLTMYKAFSSNGDYDGFGFGLFPTGGVDFKIPNIPLAVSADYRPTFFLAKPPGAFYDGVYGANFGISASYTIGEK